jgi:hypothetical protein
MGLQARERGKQLRVYISQIKFVEDIYRDRRIRTQHARALLARGALSYTVVRKCARTRRAGASSEAVVLAVGIDGDGELLTHSIEVAVRTTVAKNRIGRRRVVTSSTEGSNSIATRSSS